MHPECWPTDLAEHVHACAECAQLARDLRQLEDDWRHLPVPVEVEQAKAAFMQKLPEFRAAIAPSRSRVAPAIRWAMAAMIFVSVGSFLWMTVASGPVVASPDIMDNLLAWNLALSKADPIERQRLLEQGEETFQNDLRKAKLSQDDRKLAERFLATGRWLAMNNDPVVEVGKLSEITDGLVGRIDSSSKDGNVAETERWVNRYAKMEQGVNNTFKRVGENKGWEPDKKKAFEEMREQHEKRYRDHFQKMTEHAAPQFQKMFESMKKGRSSFPSQGPREFDQDGRR